jgi:Tfp pilus assembly protein PilV
MIDWAFKLKLGNSMHFLYNGSMNMDQKNQDGFSLLEVIISLGLLIMIIGLMPMITVVQQSNIHSAGSTSMTNIAMSLSESLGMMDYSDVGSDSFANCTDAEGYVANSSTEGVCVEGPLNQLGYTNASNSSDDVYMYYRYSVVCTSAANLPGGYTQSVCDLPSANYVGGPVVDDLACNASEYSNISKEIKVVVAYRDKNGKCKKTSLRSWKVSY